MSKDQGRGVMSPRTKRGVCVHKIIKDSTLFIVHCSHFQLALGEERGKRKKWELKKERIKDIIS